VNSLRGARPREGRPKIGVAIIGYGISGSVFHAPVIQATEGFQIRAVVTSDADRASRAHRDLPSARIVATADQLWQLDETVDLIVIASANRAHFEHAAAALRLGKTVVVDKPLTPTVGEAAKLLKLADASPGLLTVYQNRRWDDDFRTLQALIAEQRLGPPLRLESRLEFCTAFNPRAWREDPDPDAGGGVLLDLGSHLIDQVLELFPRPTSIYSEIHCRRPGAAVDDDCFVAITFGEISTHLWMSKVAHRPGPRFRYAALGGTWECSGLDPQWQALADRRRPQTWTRQAKSRHASITHHSQDGSHVTQTTPLLCGDYRMFYEQLRNAIQGSGPVPVEPQAALRTLEVIEAARQSAVTRAIIEIPSSICNSQALTLP
jgi:scyllo-inositol 2-dehydrogenase (NADP+)